MIGKTEYFELYAERPRKFDAKEVGFMPIAKDDRLCCSCINWFYSPSMGFGVCQIFRPADDSGVEATSSCAFWTQNNEDFPHLEESDARTDG